MVSFFYIWKESTKCLLLFSLCCLGLSHPCLLYSPYCFILPSSSSAPLFDPIVQILKEAQLTIECLKVSTNFILVTTIDELSMTSKEDITRLNIDVNICVCVYIHNLYRYNLLILKMFVCIFINCIYL